MKRKRLAAALIISLALNIAGVAYANSTEINEIETEQIGQKEVYFPINKIVINGLKHVPEKVLQKAVYPEIGDKKDVSDLNKIRETIVSG